MVIHIKCPHCERYEEYKFDDIIVCKCCGKEFSVVEGKQPALAEG